MIVYEQDKRSTKPKDLQNGDYCLLKRGKEEDLITIWAYSHSPLELVAGPFQRVKNMYENGWRFYKLTKKEISDA